MEKQQYQLICSYVKGKYFVSTIYRQASTIEPMWYFETMAWDWNNETKERGKIIEMDDSGVDEESAFNNHLLIIKKLTEI